MNLFYKVWKPVYTGTETVTAGIQNLQNDPLIPETWANESIAILIENMVIGNLVHKDFQDEIAQVGDVVNTRKPSEFKSKRKIDSESVVTQTAEVTNVQVKLNQHHHVSFYLKDGEESLSFKSLVDMYLEPALIAIAQAVDKVLLGQHIQFEANCAGTLTGLSTTTAIQYLTDLRKVMNQNKVPNSRNLIIGPSVEATLLQLDTFTEADKVGDDGTSLREASLGRKYAFNIYMCQNMSEFTNADIATATTTTAALAVGATVIPVTAATNIAVGEMLTVVGDLTPHRVISIANTTDITVSPAMKAPCGAGAAVNIYDSGLIDQASTAVANGATAAGVAGYREGWHGSVVINTIAATPSIVAGMQLVISPSSTVCATIDAKYTVIEVVSTGSSTATVLLDRPLDAFVADNAFVSFYPTGNYAFAFNRNALTLVTRPLKTPRAGMGALSAVVNYDGLAVRVTMSYNGEKQGTLVTVDLLMGTKVLDSKLGAVLYC